MYYCYFFSLVNDRSAENKMDSSNLSVILAPNLLQFGDATEKMNANTEKHLKLQAAVVHCFIENAYSFGNFFPVIFLFCHAFIYIFLRFNSFTVNLSQVCYQSPSKRRCLP